jgi:hypothetical protein
MKNQGKTVPVQGKTFPKTGGPGPSSKEYKAVGRNMARANNQKKG